VESDDDAACEGSRCRCPTAQGREPRAVIDREDLVRDRLIGRSLVLVALATACALLAGLTACGGDDPSGLAASKKAAGQNNSGNGNGSGTGTDSTGQRPDTTGQEPATGPVVAVQLSPANVTATVGNYVLVYALALNAEGRALPNKKFTWRSANEAVVAVSDTGLLRAVALGTTTVYASVDGKEGSAVVTVVARQEEPPPVDKFTVRGVVLGDDPGPDTMRVVRVPGATATLYRVGDAKGDTLNPRVQVASATSDAQGEFVFADVPSGYYTIEVKAPSSGPFEDGSTGFGPQRMNEVRVAVRLRRKG
jgi:hypothetical protein